jgi:hypothetical protein
LKKKAEIAFFFNSFVLLTSRENIMHALMILVIWTIAFAILLNKSYNWRWLRGSGNLRYVATGILAAPFAVMLIPSLFALLIYKIIRTDTRTHRRVNDQIIYESAGEIIIEDDRPSTVLIAIKFICIAVPVSLMLVLLAVVLS